jgi:hypothetical protein
MTKEWHTAVDQMITSNGFGTTLLNLGGKKAVKGTQYKLEKGI